MTRSLWLLLCLPLTSMAAESRAPLPKSPVVIGQWDVGLVVKWSDGLGARTTDLGDLRLGTGAVPAEVQAVLDQHDLFLEPWLGVHPTVLADLEDRAYRNSGKVQPDLAAMHRVIVPQPTRKHLQEVADALLALDQVEFVAGDAEEVPPPGDIAPETPDLTDRQDWLGTDPGIDAVGAWTFGVDGSGVRVSDCEYGWHHAHEDLVDADLEPEPGQTVDPAVAGRGWDHHGTAVAGEIVGQHNGYGVDGIAPAATFATYSEWTVEEGGRRGTAIANAIADSGIGDVVLLEMQYPGPDGRYAPAEVNQAVWTLSRAGVDAGVVVVGAAGNGTANLDSSTYAAYRSWGDSGAIIVGAGASNTSHSKLGFSSYGDRVDVQGWGQNVFTTGYGRFARYGGDDNQAYTASFSGTSSASPFVAGSAALIQDMAKRYRPSGLGPGQIREILADTGTPAPDGAGIGPLPYIPAALDEVERRLDVQPAIVSVDGPLRLNEGTEATLIVETQILPTHTGEVWWMVDGVRTDGDSLVIEGVDDGPIGLTVHVQDDWARTAERSVTVDVQNVPPTIERVVVEGHGTEGSADLLAVEWSDPGPNDTVTAEWTVNGKTIGTGESLNWTAADDGTYQIEVVVIDDDGGRSEVATYERTIDDVVAELTLNVPETAPRKTDIDLSVDLFDPGDDTHTLAWFIDGAPAGSDTTVTTSWTEKGPHEIRVVATDEDGVEVETTATIEVVPRGGCGCSTGAGPAGGVGLLGLVMLGLVRRRR